MLSDRLHAKAAYLIQNRQTTMNPSFEKAGWCWPSILSPKQRSIYLFRPDPKPKKPDANSQVASQDKPFAATLETIICRQCGHVITSPAERKVIDGAHAHTFANPQGIVFEITCYRNAWGCGYVGAASHEFTWFVGYIWRIAVCANCHVHIGWRFSAPDGHFFHGLITDRLILTDA